MGSCVSIISSRLHLQATQAEAGAVAPPPDTSALELEDLLRLGIAEAQTATVARKKRVRLQHLHTARELLTVALRRCGQRDPDLSAHLVAVLLKLGEDARTVQGLLVECATVPAGAASSSGNPATGEKLAVPLSPKAPSPLTSEHSSEHVEPAAVRLWEYDELKEGLLCNSEGETESPVERLASCASPSELGSEAVGPVGGSTEGLDTSGRSLPASLSPVKEGEDGVESAGSMADEEVPVADASRTTSRSSSAPPYATKQEPSEVPAPEVPAKMPEAPQAQAAPRAAHGPLEGILGRLGRGRGVSDAKEVFAGPSQGGQESQEPGEAAPETRGPLEGILGRLSRARGSSYAVAHEAEEPQQPADEGPEASAAESTSCPQSPEWPSPLCPAAARSPLARHASDDSFPGAAPQFNQGDGTGGSDTREALKESITRLRACVQPQQAGGSQLGGSKRRNARSISSHEASKPGEASAVQDAQCVGSVRPRSPHVAVRHNRKQQPSQQSSSSGSVSDSDGSGVGKWHSMSFGAATKDHLASVCICGHAFTPDSVFCRICGKKRPPEVSESKGWRAFAPPTRSGTTTPSSTVLEEDWPAQFPNGRTRQDTSPNLGCAHHATESQETSAYRQAALAPVVAGAETPFRAPRSAATTPALQEASPSPDVAIRDPLSQAELMFGSSMLPAKGGNSLTPKGCAASPYAEISVSFDDFSIPASCMPSAPQSMAPSAAPSPFCGGALSRPDGTPPTPVALTLGAATQDFVSVRILNGVSGEEEVRLSMPVQACSEQHFLNLLDRLCQQRTGQPLSGLNWLSQAQPGSRFQRRKCDLGMVQELFSKGGRQRNAPLVLLLCTVPVRPPSELAVSKVRLKNLVPAQVACRAGAPSAMAEAPVKVQLDTSPLDGGHDYTVAFTHQWSNMTYMAEAVLLPSQRGVEVTVPWQMLSASNQNTEGLYDVHLVIDSNSRSDNRRTLTVGSSESELSSSSVSQACSGSSFIPIREVTN